LAVIPKSFLPSQETGEFRVVLRLPAGVSIDAMDRLARDADERIRARPEVARTVVTVGGSVGERNQAEVLVLLKPPGQRRQSTDEVKDSVRKILAGLPGASTSVEDLLDIGGGAGRPFTVNITGDDFDRLKATSQSLVETLRRGSDLKDVDSSYRAGASELRWVIDPARAESFGISSAEVGQELRLFIAGATPARYHEGGREYDVRVRLRPDQRDLRTTFPRVVVPNLNHRLIPLSLVARQVQSETPAKIERQDRRRFIEVTADINPHGHGLAAALAETRRLFDSGRIPLTGGTGYEFSGQTKDFQDLLGSVITAVLLAVGAMYLVLASLYDSFFVPLSIMLVLPLAVCGAFYALGITGSSLDIYSMIGCILLMGVAAKNSILLVDHIHEGVRGGKGLDAAILRAGQVRLRPILMTSFALVAGMLPMALPLQESARQRAPMAIAVIGGVITSTLLTLVVVPAAYGYILRAQRWVVGRLKGLIRPVRWEN
jgi:HAE1 family hydrophobic/amphiphilic exporter-1